MLQKETSNVDRGRSTHLIIQYVIIFHKEKKDFWATIIILFFTSDRCSTNTDAQGQDAVESQSYRQVFVSVDACE